MQALRGGRPVQQWGSFGSLDTAARVGPPLRVTPMEPPVTPSLVHSLGAPWERRVGAGAARAGFGTVWYHRWPCLTPGPPAAYRPWVL
jgi:hypothetical protein